jgi:hypothetical protein
MKVSHLISGIIAFFLISFLVEPALVSWLVNLLPASLNDWKSFLKVIIWIVVFFSGLGVSVVVSIIIGAIFGTIFSK